MGGNRGVIGSYLLLIKLDSDAEVVIGALGKRGFAAGRYVYIGSAMGGLEQRVARHLRSEKRLRWHIDHLLTVASEREALLVPSSMALECDLARLIASLPGAAAVKGFGCSDCRCSSHLFHLADGTADCLRECFPPRSRRLGQHNKDVLQDGL